MDFWKITVVDLEREYANAKTQKREPLINKCQGALHMLKNAWKEEIILQFQEMICSVPYEPIYFA